MDSPRKDDIIIRFTVYGLLIGLFFPAGALLLATLLGEVNFSLQGLAFLHRVFPAQYFIDIVPFCSALAGYYLGMSIYEGRQSLFQVHNLNTGNSLKISAFVNKLIHNELDAEYNLEDRQDILGESLIKLRDNVRKNQEEQARRKREDDQKNWVSAGLAKFAELLRMHGDDMEEFAFNIISNLVKYLSANQGGFYLAEEEEVTGRYFSMKACYAYDRKKFTDKKIRWDEGLIGTCAMERQSIYISEIPDGYLTITSGLGYAGPRYLLIVPLIIQTEIFGMIEIASFHAIETYQIRFVESVAESIAMTLSGLKSSIRTAELLKASRKQAEALAFQEDKMRRNMEELKMIQEEAALQAEKFISFTNSVNHTLIRAEYATDGTLLYANTKFLRMLGYFSNSEVEGQHIFMFIDKKDQEWFKEIWERLSTGGKHYEGYMKHVTRQGQDLWTMATYTCVRKEDGSVQKILFLAIDTTEQKKQSLDYEGQIDAINRLNISAQFAPDGKFISCNELFLETMKYTRKELERMSVFDFFDKKDIENFSEVWENVVKGIPYRGQLKNLTRYEDEKWFRATYSAVNDMYGEVAKVIYLANEITSERLMEIESRRQTDKLKIQEEKLKLTGFEQKKKLEQTKLELAAEYAAIEKERSRFMQVLDGLPDLVLTIDQSANIIYINPAAERFWQMQKNQVIGKSVHRLFPGDASKYDVLIINYLSPGVTKITGEKRRVRIMNNKGKWIGTDMIVTISEVKDEVSYTAVFSKLPV